MTEFRLRFLILAVLVMILTVLSTYSSAQSTCDYYASPDGSGDGSQASPFRIADFWGVVSPGKTLCLLDGSYQGSPNMINPPSSLSGAEGSPITVRALNDGKVTLDGQFDHRPVFLDRNDWFVIEGMNAHSSSNNVVALFRTGNSVVRRVVAWDANDRNYKVFALSSGYPVDDTDTGGNLFEDIAGFGIARKIFSSYTTNDTTVRRAWLSWDGSHFSGPKMAMTMAYRNTGMLAENIIATATASRMRDSYTLGCHGGSKYPRCGATLTGVDQFIGVIGSDALDGSQDLANKRLLGSIAYVENSAKHAPAGAIRSGMSGVEWKDVVGYVEPGRHTDTTRAGGFTGRSKHSREVINSTFIGGRGNSLTSGSTLTNVEQGVDVASVSSIYTAGGAEICYRYVNGVKTDEPLWPWPMNQRIIDAMTQAGYAPVDVTAKIEAMFGTIPDQCKKQVTPPPPPPPSAVELVCNDIKKLFTMHCE